MKLKDLSKKAARLPELSFTWSCDGHLSNDDTIIALKNRTAEHSIAIANIVDAYNQLKEVILEADIGG